MAEVQSSEPVSPAGIERNLFTLTILRALSCCFLWVPTLVIYFQSNGITLQEVFILKAILMATSIVLEIPSGYLADLVGRKASIVFGGFGLLLAMVLYLTGNGFSDFAIAEIAAGIGYSFISGADSALLYDSLLQLGREKEYQRREGKITAAGNYAEAFGGLLGGWTASFSLYYPYYLQIGLFSAFILLAMVLTEPSRHVQIDRTEKLRTFISLLRRAFFEDRRLRSILFYNACDGAAVYSIVWLCQPYMTEIGVPLAYFGVIWFILHLWLGICSTNSASVSSSIGEIRLLSWLVYLSALGFFLMAIANAIWGVLALLLFYTARGFRSPLLRTMINAHTESAIRATTISILRFAGSVAFLVIGPLLGWISDSAGLKVALFSGAIIFALLGAMNVRSLRRAYAA